MYKTRVAVDAGKMVYVEMDPSQRYGRFKDVLGKGAIKTVYKAFDEFRGMEVAWNQVKLTNVFGSPEELQRLYSEVQLLDNLNHHSIMRFHASWIDVDRTTFNFITEMFTSGTLRAYRKKHKRLNIRAIKDWARQILEGLNYLHSHDPPVIHRDLKCDNIFVNGHLGQVKIGDLGLAAILHGSHQAHSVIGTPEFMAPELYEEEYDELVDIYSFGMCVLEMLTCEYPYNECSNPAQIYKKVTSGKLPEAFHRIVDVEARRFVGRCLEKVPDRPSAGELLMDPFLSTEDIEELRAPSTFSSAHKVVPVRRTDMSITGTMNPQDDTIYLKVQISHKDGPQRNVYFPFDTTSDTSLDVATEMVKELEITDWKPFEIANMIEEEISTLVPSWMDSSSSQILQQHSLKYAADDHDDEDDDDNSPHHPFYNSTSSFSSSQASLPSLFSLYGTNLYAANSLQDWLNSEEACTTHDDTSSQSSFCSDNHSCLKYTSVNEDNLLSSTFLKEGHCNNSKIKKCTRFCPEATSKDKEICNNNYLNVDGCGLSECRYQQGMVRTRSMVDIRSQLLHQKLVEEINRRRMFKTVGAVEEIGYHEPAGDFSSYNDLNAMMLPRKSIRDGGTTRQFKYW